MATQTTPALPDITETADHAPIYPEITQPGRFRLWLTGLSPARPRNRVSGRRGPGREPRRRTRALLAAVPVVGVNSASFAAQLAFLRAHLPWPLPGQVLVAITLESVAVYLAYHAHVAQLADDAAFRLRLAAYAFAAVIGTMNYSHYCAPHWRPTFAAVAFGLCSAASPWLWSVHSRRESRDSLMARGLIEPHAVRLGATRWLWHPFRSARVMWHATWAGVNEVERALALTEAATSAPIELDTTALNTMSARERLCVAFGTIGELDVPKALALLRERGVTVDQSTAYQIRKAIASAQTTGNEAS